MIYTEKVKQAISIMFEKHKNQIDKGGTPYIFHPWHVAEMMEDENRTITALLHDVLEDTNTTIEDLYRLGFNEEILTALKLLAHNSKEDYFEYIKKIASNDIARDVKLADLKHNSDLSRLTQITEKDLKRHQKYQKCISYLENIKQEKSASKLYVKR